MESKKNTLVLTVIAVATLIVFVVGATFAFFQARVGDNVSKAVTVTTGTTGNTTFAITGAIAITADQTTFASGKGDITGSTTGTVQFVAPTKVGGDIAAADLKTCYTVTVNITSNNFVYTSGSTPELVLDVTKGSTKVIESQDITTTKTNIQVPTAKGGTTYTHTLTASSAGATVTDNWTVEVILKNLNTDQQNNTGKTFSGSLSFAKATC